MIYMIIHLNLMKNHHYKRIINNDEKDCQKLINKSCIYDFGIINFSVFSEFKWMHNILA